MRWRVKKLSTGGAWGDGGTIQIASWKCNFGIYLEIQVHYLYIQAITTLLCLLLVLYVLVPCIFSIFYLTIALLKSDIFRHSKAYSSRAPPVFNLQASDWVHCEEETGVYYQLSRLTYKLVILIFFKVAYFMAKKCPLFKKFPKMYSFFFNKR